MDLDKYQVLLFYTIFIYSSQLIKQSASYGVRPAEYKSFQIFPKVLIEIIQIC